MKKAVEVQRLFAHAARADFPAAFFILGERRVIYAPGTERIRFEHHFPSPQLLLRMIAAGRTERPAASYSIVYAFFFVPCFFVARMNSASNRMANTMPMGYATAVL